MRRIILVAMIVFGLAVIVLTFAKHTQHQLQVTTYFRDAHGLRAGAPVQVAGVDVGRVTDVRVRPELKEHPAEVVLLFQTPYKLEIPSDSVVLLRRAGLLGETYAEVDIRSASGPPVGNQGALKAHEEEARQTKEEGPENPGAAKPDKPDHRPPLAK
jgi:phospholipid/cholesterol/gamma-HCH transport system substrate-binding protein